MRYFFLKRGGTGIWQFRVVELFDCNLGIKMRAVSVKVFSKKRFRFLPKEITEKIKFLKNCFLREPRVQNKSGGTREPPPLVQENVWQIGGKGIFIIIIFH